MDKEYLKKIGDRLRDLRAQSGMTQQKVADEIHIALRSYSDYERGENVPPTEYLIRLADLYGVSTDFILARSDFRTGKGGEYVSAVTGLSDTTIRKLHYIHTWDKWITSHTYDEQHKNIDIINLIFEKDRADLLYNIYEYIHSGNIVMPDSVTVFDDTGTGHTLPAASLYRSVRLHDITKCLDEMTP